MSEHTPGPWVVFDDHPDKACFHIYEKNGLNERDPIYRDLNEIATIYRYQCNPRDTLADARLIAAAPELLEALRWYAELAEDLNRYPWTVESTLAELRNDGGKRAKEAIAKVKGEDS